MSELIRSAALLLALATPAAAQDYRCAAWTPAGEAQDISELGIGKSMATLKQGDLRSTIRMAEASLTRRTYLDGNSALIVYGDFVRGADGPEFGRKISVQRLIYDAESPKLLQTTCEATR